MKLPSLPLLPSKLRPVLLGLLALLLTGASLLWQHQHYQQRLARAREQQLLQAALLSRMGAWQTADGHWHYEKKTIQASPAEVLRQPGLTPLQRRVVTVARRQPRVITAAVLIQRVTPDQPVVVPVASRADSTVVFAVRTDTMRVVARVSGVAPGPRPELRLDSLELRNEQTIVFQWGEKKEGYPISLRVENSNPYFQQTAMESYAIPQLQKDEIKPTLGVRLRKNGGVLLKVGGPALLLGTGLGLWLGAAN
jgi:hypothetical protein